MTAAGAAARYRELTRAYDRFLEAVESADVTAAQARAALDTTWCIAALGMELGVLDEELAGPLPDLPWEQE